MRRSIAAVFAMLALAGPVIAQDATPAAKPKMRKICKSVNNGNPMFPEMKCHSVPVEDATPAATPVQAAAVTPPASTQMAMQNQSSPH